MQYLQVKWRDTNKIRACHKLIHYVHVYLLCIHKGLQGLPPPMNGSFKKKFYLSVFVISIRRKIIFKK